MSTTAQIFEIEPYKAEPIDEAEELRRSRRPPRVSPTPRANRPVRRPPQRQPRSPADRWTGGGSAAPSPEPATDLPTDSPSEYVSWVQATLNRALGTALIVNGVMSISVRAAIRDFQRRNRLPVSGYIGPDTEAALRRLDTGGPGSELEFELEFELSPDARAAEYALSNARHAVPIDTALKSLGRATIAGLYRFFRADGRFYTGMAMDLRRRIVQHLWCLSHFGVSSKNFKLNLYRMPGAHYEQVRLLESSINRHHANTDRRLNRNTELEFQELAQI